jgi:hypothetical protein
MPIIEDTPPSFSAPVAPQAPEPVAPGFGEVLGAGFELENDVLNAIDLLTRPQFKADPLFAGRLGEELRNYDTENRTSFFDDYRDNFLGVQSREEMLAKMAQIQEEQQQRDTLSRGGFGGLVAATAAGMLSPTSFIPLVGPLARTRNAWQFAKSAALLGAGVGVAQEGVLQVAQEDRPWSETMIGVASSTLVSGILGGAIGALGKGEMAVIENGMKGGVLAVVDTTPGAGIPTSAGAASTIAQPIGGFASGANIATRVLDSNFLTRSPVTYNIRQTPSKPWLTSSVARSRMTSLSDGSLRYQENDFGRTPALGGTIENNIQTYYNAYPSIASAIDKGFLDYRFGAAPPRVAPTWQAQLTDYFGKSDGKYSRSEFKGEISKALRNGDQHELPEIANIAKKIRAELFDPLLRAAQAVGIIPKEVDLKGDVSWLFRDFRRDIIRKKTGEFVEKLATYYERKLIDDFAKESDKLRTAKARTDEAVTDLGRPVDEVEELRERFKAQLEELEEPAEEFDELTDLVSLNRKLARELRSEPEGKVFEIDGKRFTARERRRQLLRDARDMEKMGGEKFAELKAKRADLRRRLSNLTKSAVALEERQGRKLAKIDAIEELNMNALRRAARAGHRILSQIDKWSDAKLDKEISALRTRFARVAQTFDNGEARLKTLVEGEEDATTKILALDEFQAKRADRLTEIAERLADAEDLGRPALRSLINDGLEEALARINETSMRRSMRAQRLLVQAENLDPKQAADRIAGLRAKMAEREANLTERWRELGAEDIDLQTGLANFRQQALVVANETKDKIMGTYVRLPTVDAIRGVRGSEIARTLDIPSSEVEEFLENDIEKLMRSTLRTLPPDIEIAKRPEFGDVNGEQALKLLGEERNQRIEELKDKNLTPEVLERRTEEINATFDQYARNMEAVIGRLRHTWGMPTDPEAIGFRLGKVLQNLNVLRFMGGVVIASVPDIARPIMRYGLTRTFRDGFVPLVTNFKQFKVSAREVKALAGGLSATMQSRAAAIFDMLDDVGRGTKFERGLEYTTQRFGAIALFDYWTQGMKQFSGVVAHGKFMDSIDLIVNGGSKKDVKEATRFLAENGIDAGLAQRIWGQMASAGGAQKVDGQWWPNTEAWTDREVKQAYSAAIHREVNTTIVTPGVDKPLWMDQSMMGRLLGQFKSFAMASTTRTVISGMQQRDAAILNGVMFSLALGALGYYLYSVAAGGKAYEEMSNAGMDKWADEAIARSGLLGILAEVQRIAERIPATQPYATFSGTRSTRRGGDNLVEAVLGPSFDALGTGAEVVTGLDEPTESTVHQLRTLLPFQNVFYLRQLFDMVEAAVPVPETRQ